MKNYNGPQPPFVLSNQPNGIRSPQNSQSRSALKNAASATPDFTAQELKHEYTKGNAYMDKLKSEVSSLKSSRKATFDLKIEANGNEESSPQQKDLNSKYKKRSERENEQLLWELDEENQDLKSQLEAAMVRITKLHREKQALQDRLDPQTPNKDVVSEIKSLNQQIKVLTIRLQELEDDNIKLLKYREKASSKTQQKPSSGLIRYIKYVFKLISSLPHANFAKTCFEERFPRETNIAELLESGEYEGVLLKSFKFITDVLINLNSLATEEHDFKAPETPLDATSQYTDYHSSRMVSPRSGKGSVIGEFAKKRQPSQEGLGSFEASLENSETPSALRSPYSGSKGSKKLQDLEHSREALLKITGVPENDRKTPKAHSRHYSTISKNEVNEGDEGKDVSSSKAKKESSQWEGKYGNNSNVSGVSRYEEENFTSIVYGKRRNEHNENDVTERHKEREVKEYKSPRHDKTPIEEQYKSKYGRSKQVSSSKYEYEEADGKREEEQNEKKSYSGIRQSKTPKASKSYTRELQIETRSRSQSRDRESSQDSEIDLNSIGFRDREYKSKGLVSPRKNTVDFGKKSLIIDQGIREATHESCETTEDRYEKKGRRTQSKIKINEIAVESVDEKDDTRDVQEMWDRKREELARISRKMSSHNVDPETKGKGYSTFRVSFGRTESKSRMSMSPSNRDTAAMIDVPKKKKNERGTSNVMTPKSTRADGGKTIRFVLDEEPKKSYSNMKKKELKKSFSTEKAGFDNDVTPKKR